MSENHTFAALQGRDVAKSRPESGYFRGFCARLRGCCKVETSPKAVPKVAIFAPFVHGSEAVARSSFAPILNVFLTDNPFLSSSFHNRYFCTKITVFDHEK